MTQRRALYAACRDACGASRRALCVARLKETLAERGAAGDATKTTDPARFVSDLLAWTHQTLATEADVARGLFGDDGLKALVSAAVEGLAAAVGDRIGAALGRLTEDAAAAHARGLRLRLLADALAAKIGRGPLPRRWTRPRRARADGGRRRAAGRRGGTVGGRAADAAPAEGVGRGGGHRARGRRAARAVVRGAGGDGGAGTVVALALDPVLASYKAQLEAEVARDFAGPPFGAGADSIGSGAGDADAVVATAAWCCGAADDACSRLRALPLATPSSTAYAGRFAAFAEACAETCAREAASRLLRRCSLEPMLLRCRKVELLQARGEVLGPAAEAISRETLSAALRAFYSALFQDPAPDLDAIAPTRGAPRRTLCAKILAHAHASVFALAADEGLAATARRLLVHSP